MGLKDKILAQKDLIQEPVSIPEWPEVDGQIYVRTMTGVERDDYEGLVFSKQRNGKPQDLRGLKSRLVVLCAVDENGDRIFADKDEKDLQQKSAAAINRVADVALSLNGFTEKDVEALAKN